MDISVRYKIMFLTIIVRTRLFIEMVRKKNVPISLPVEFKIDSCFIVFSTILIYYKEAHFG